MLAAFFGNAKMVLGAAAGIAVTIFLAIFKARGKEIEEQKEEIEEFQREANFKVVLDEISEEIETGYEKKKDEIGENYDYRQTELFKTYPDKPLSPTLLSKLRDSQGLSDKRSESPE